MRRRENQKPKMKDYLQMLLLFLAGGGCYMLIEILYRGYTHWTMGILGGACFVIIGGLNNYVDWGMPVLKQALIGSLLITCFEFAAGVLLNLILRLNIWDYSQVPLNLLGQICLPFSLIWFGLSIVAVYVDDGLRVLLFKTPFPKHKWV